MPLTGACAWKETGIGPEERIDRFFNLIDHAVSNGVDLRALYTRKHVKEFVLYTLRQGDSFCRTLAFTQTEDHLMTTLTLTNKNPSPLVVGDPGHITAHLLPAETKTLEVNEAQLAFLMPQLEQLKAANWLSYAVGEGAVPAPAPVVSEVPPIAPPAAAAAIVPPVVAPADAPPPEDKGEEVAPEGDESKKEE